MKKVMVLFLAAVALCGMTPWRDQSYFQQVSGGWSDMVYQATVRFPDGSWIEARQKCEYVNTQGRFGATFQTTVYTPAEGKHSHAFSMGGHGNTLECMTRTGPLKLEIDERGHGVTYGNTLYPCSWGSVPCGQCWSVIDWTAGTLGPYYVCEHHQQFQH